MKWTEKTNMNELEITFNIIVVNVININIIQNIIRLK